MWLNAAAHYRAAWHAHQCVQAAVSKAGSTASVPTGEEMASDDESARRAETIQKVEQIKASLEQKKRARARYDAYVQESQGGPAGTDYALWDLWCPEDEEDELVASCTPQSAQLQALEKDIDDRHKRYSTVLTSGRHGYMPCDMHERVQSTSVLAGSMHCLGSSSFAARSTMHAVTACLVECSSTSELVPVVQAC